MVTRERTTTVQMPASPDLYPSHVVAIRPGIDGAWAGQGEYVLTVDTPRGARNVVASVEGEVEVHVELMQDLEPATVLFVVHPAVAPFEHDEDGYEATDIPASAPKRNIPPPPPSAAASAAPPETRAGGLFWLYLAVCLFVAVLWPGLVYAFHDLNDISPNDLIIAAGIWGAGLGALVLLFGALRTLGGLKKSAIAMAASLCVFAASLSGGVLAPSIEELHRNGVASVVKRVLSPDEQVAERPSPTKTVRASSKHSAPQIKQVTFPSLMAMLAAPMRPGSVVELARPKKQTLHKAKARSAGAGNYGPIMELIAIPFNR